SVIRVFTSVILKYRSMGSSSMATYHKVEQGEYIAKIASQYGFTKWQPIWDHPKNAQLKKQRQNPDVLYPDDLLFIPDKADKQESRGTTQVHQFQIPSQTVMVRVVLE